MKLGIGSAAAFCPPCTLAPPSTHRTLVVGSSPASLSPCSWDTCSPLERCTSSGENQCLFSFDESAELPELNKIEIILENIFGDIFLDGFDIPSRAQGEHNAHLEKFCAEVGFRAVPLLSLAPVVGDVGEGESLTI